MNPQTVTVGNTQIRILSTIKGLVSESEIVENEMEAFEPDLVTLSVGPEEIDGTRKWDGQRINCTLMESRPWTSRFHKRCVKQSVTT